MLVDQRMHDDRPGLYQSDHGQSQSHRQQTQQLRQRPGRRIHLRRIGAAAGGLIVAGLLAANVPGVAAGARTRALPVHLEILVEGLPRALNRITATVSTAPRARCTLTVHEPGPRPRSFGSWRRGSVAWQWTSSVAGELGQWRLVATCREGRRWRRWRLDAQPGLPSIGGAFVSAPGVHDAEPTVPVPAGTPCDRQGICFGEDPFSVGQCTWYALGRRPDLAGIVDGNASAWLEVAAGKAPEGTTAAGFHAAPGALAVWAANVPPAGPEGHVAYVAAVGGPHGSRLLVDDSNWRPTPQSPGEEVHEHWVSASSVEGYIYPPGYHPAG